MKDIPNVILIVMDTVRADHLSCYGYHRKTTPNIDKLAKRGILFENAFSAAMWSPPSHASIFTGKYPSYHRTLGKNVYLDKRNITLAETLSSNNYKTLGISNCALLRPSSGFDKGFQEYIVPSERTHRYFRKAEGIGFILSSFRHGATGFIRALVSGPDSYTYYTNKIIRRFLRKNRSLQYPFFIFVNYFNCHAPYTPRRHFSEKFLSGFSQPRLYVLESLLEKIFGVTAKKLRDSDLNIEKLQYIANRLEARFSFMAKKLQVSEKEWEVIKALYDGEIAYLDHYIGDLINLLRDEGLFENTLVIITADHGENFGQHGLAGHHFCLYDSLLHIPLIMSYPPVFSGGDRVSKTVSTIDIFPTIMSICGIRLKTDIQGKSLHPLGEQDIHKFVCAECGESVLKTDVPHLRDAFSPFSSKLKAIDVGFKCIRDNRFKYMLSANGGEQLYDVLKDPLERKNIVNKLPDKAKELRKQMEKIINVNYYGPREIVGTEAEKKRIMERLRSLGYA